MVLRKTIFGVACLDCISVGAATNVLVESYVYLSTHAIILANGYGDLTTKKNYVAENGNSARQSLEVGLPISEDYKVIDV